MKYCKYALKLKTINQYKTTEFVVVIKLFLLFTCIMCSGIVHVYINTCDISNSGLPAQLIHVCNMYICI